MSPFHLVCPELAARETRSVMVGAGLGLPAGQYTFAEFYCPDQDCDCRRVFIQIVSSERAHVAVRAVLVNLDRQQIVAQNEVRQAALGQHENICRDGITARRSRGGKICVLHPLRSGRHSHALEFPPVEIENCAVVNAIGKGDDHVRWRKRDAKMAAEVIRRATQEQRSRARTNQRIRLDV